MNTIQTEIENQTINKIKPNQGVDNGIEDWMECTLGEISIIYNGNSINAKMKAEKYSNCKTGLSYIGTKDVGFDCKINYDNGIKIPFNEPKFKIAPEGSILVCSEGGSAGKKTAFVEKEICFGNKLYAITNEKNYFNGKYVFYFTRYNKFLDSFRNKMNGIIGGVSQRKFSQIIIPLPPLPIQRAIVKKIEELFSSLDSGIADLKKAQEQLKIYRQAVLKKAFEGEFKMVELREIIDRIEAGKSFRCDERPPNEGEVGIIKVSAITWGSFQENESKTVTDNSKINSRYFIKEGDFLLSRANTIELVGNSVIVNKIKKTLMLSDKSLRIVFNKNFNPFFALHFLSSVDGKNQIQLLSTGNQDSMRNIGQERIKQIKIPLPNFQEQQKIVREIESRLSVCDKVEESIKESLNKAEALRQSILKKAFEGRLLSEAEIEQCKSAKDYEPASVLLEKIKAEKKQK